MLMTYRVRPSKREEIPATTHVDGTGRLQTVSRKTNPLYWKLIKAFEVETGVPVLLNTSFRTPANRRRRATWKRGFPFFSTHRSTRTSQSLTASRGGAGLLPANSHGCAALGPFLTVKRGAQVRERFSYRLTARTCTPRRALTEGSAVPQRSGAPGAGWTARPAG